ncbi:MAG: sodium-extruding oxaloacetate decarboxylase subunit alpha [SAR86 cluster bacterium]|uniref:Sodium-extruding oxaloacetate decarboxylase subunit alpha n=1 Tax=SAR86 cluster bacterium TaxID=2030880 RepID=A0A937I9W5_9GAMM|nr:sodium-extruding oxaloacetate decarboxylase subunit alpha [SAR86 cluster bacterium]
MNKKKIGITEVVLRDGHQSILATRLRYEDMEAILSHMDSIGYWSVESWGGAIFDSCIRYLGEDPWERIRKIKSNMPNTPQQMLLRGQNLLGYKHYSDEIVYKFIEKSKENGVDVYRIFDALNDYRNMETAIKATIDFEGHAQGTISYTTSPVHNMKTWVDLGKKLQDLGCHSLAIKDMAGLLDPYVGFELVSKLKEVIEIPIHLHSHATTGMSTTTAIKCAEAGVDNIDTSISSMSLTYGHSPTETVVGILNDADYETNISLESLEPIAKHFREIRKKYSNFEGSLKGVDARIITSQVPGGMLTNLENQLKEQNAIDKFDEVIEEIPKVRADLGYIPLVTPTSQIVGTQAVINVLNNERYKVITKETSALLKGEYGKTPSAVDKYLQSKVLNGDEPVTCRPADLIDKNEYDLIKEKYVKAIKEKNIDIENNEENILIFTLFPEIGLKFLENKNNKEFFEKSPTQITEEKEGFYKIVIDDTDYLVKYSKTNDPEIINGDHKFTKDQNIEDKVSLQEGLIITAPLAGNIFKIEKKVGDKINQDETVVVLEAMKMETTIKTPSKGTIKKIFIKDGDKVQPGEALFEVI